MTAQTHNILEDPRNRKVDELRFRAEQAKLAGDESLARELLGQAAKIEEELALLIQPDQPRTLGIFAVSAASLYVKAGDHQNATRVARHFLLQPLHAGPRLTLQKLLQDLE